MSSTKPPYSRLTRWLLVVTFCVLFFGFAAVVRQYSVHSRLVLSQWLLFSPDGRRLATGIDGLDDARIQVWDVPHRTQIVELDVGAADESLILSPDGGTVSLPSSNELVMVDYPEVGLNRWDLRGELKRRTEVRSGLLSPDGRRMLVERPDDAVEVHAIGTDRPPVQLAFRESDEILQVYFGADAENLVVWRWDGMIETYDLRSGMHRHSTQVKKGLPGVLSPDLRWAATFDVDSNTVHVYRLNDGATWFTIHSENDHSPHMAFSHDSRSLAVGTNEGTVTLWDLSSRREKASRSGSGGVLALGFSPDGTSLAVAHANRFRWFRQTPIRLVDPVTLDEQAVLGERNYRPHIALLFAAFWLSGFILWLMGRTSRGSFAESLFSTASNSPT